MTKSDDERRLQDERHAAVMEALGELRADCKDTTALLRVQNGRIGVAEIKIAVLEERAPSNPGKTGGLWGAVGGVIAGAVAGWFGK